MGNDGSTAQDIPKVETWNDADCRLQVTQPEGWTCKVRLQTRIQLPPDELFELLTQPDNSRVFRNIKSLKSRKVLEDDGRGRQLIEVEQDAKWKFLCFSGSFTTKLFVKQNKPIREIGFKLKESGMMKKFEGTWHIQPFNQATLDQNFGGASHGKHWASGPANVLKGLRDGFQRNKAKESSSLLTLEQSVVPNLTPPKPLEGLLKGITTRQVKNLVEDVRKEVDRRQAAKAREKPHPSTSGAPLASLTTCSQRGFRLAPLDDTAA